uniref:Uncharacterized protein n=1 Tax=Picea sitchensis TaxID=3332 RepID=A9NYP7_PICSI|nr:unknown [Picea sitchensis]
MGGHSRSSSSVFAYRFAIFLCMILPYSGARPLSAQSKSLSMEINYRKYDVHEHNQEIIEPLYQRLQLDLRPFDAMGKSAFKPVFTMLPKGPVTPSGPSPKTNSSPKAESTQISTNSVTDQP